MDEYGCPANYDELTREYFGLIREEARRKVGWKNAEDAAQNILARIIETDGLSRFDPRRGVKFATYLVSFVRLKARDERDKVARVWDHEAPIEAVESTAVVEISYEQVETRMDLQHVIDRVSDRVAEDPRLVEVWRTMAADVEECGSIRSDRIAQRLDVSLSTAKRLRYRVSTIVQEELDQIAS